MDQTISTKKKFGLFEASHKNPRFQNHRHGFEIPREFLKILQEFPKDGFRHFTLPSGIELTFVDFSVKENICMNFEINRAPLEFSFHISGNAYSDEIVQLFRFIPTSCSESNRPVIPKHSDQEIGAKRRWYFCYFSEFVS